MKYIWRILSLFFIFLITQLALSQPSYYCFKELGIKEGLSQSKVKSILTDHRGYLWIGTEYGLNCYDRDNLKQYLHQPNVEGSLPSNNIIFIAEDSLTNLWIGTAQGICSYDRSNENFEPVLTREGKPMYIASSLSVEGGVLLGGSGSIYKFVYETKKIELLYDAKNLKLYNPFWDMIRYDENLILLNSSWHGIFSFNLATKEFKRIDSFEEKNYSCIFVDSKKHLWVSVYGKGLYCYQEGQLLQHYTTSNSPLTYDVIHNIIERDNEIWLATDGGGINIISLDDFSFSHIKQIQDDVYSFPANTIFRLYLDPFNNVWAGSIRRGLIGIKNVYARSFQHVSFGNQYGLSNQTVNSFFQDRDNKIWIGTDGGGINCFDPVTSTFKHYSSTKNDKIVSIVEYSFNELLLFSFNKGLFLFNKHTGHIRPFILVNKDVNDVNCKRGYSVNIQQATKHKIIFSGQQIFVYDTVDKTFEIVASKDEEFERNSPSIIATKDDKTYFADLRDICVYDFSSKKFTAIYKGIPQINDASMSHDGSFWLATSKGLVHYDPQKEDSRLIKTSLFQEARSVIADKNNRIWVGTQNQLYVYHIETDNFIILDEVDGVLPNEYIHNATLLTQSGDVLIGGTTSMTLIDANLNFGETDVESTIEVLDVKLNGSSISIKEESETLLKSLNVPWNFSSLQIKVLLNEENIFRNSIFRFNIEGLEQEFKSKEKNSLIINYLPIGEYSVTASYYTRSGEWSSEQNLFYIIVIPPWWKTVWFAVGVSFLLILLTLSIVYYYHRKKKAQQRKEIAQLKAKTAREKINFLTNISHELRTPLTLICAPLKRIINKETEREEGEQQLVHIFKQAQQMKNIIDMVLDIRKLDERKGILNIHQYSFNEWIRSVGDKFIYEFNNKGLKLEYELDDRIEKVYFDRDKCDFVVSNFLMNALKFSESGTTTTLMTSFLKNENAIEVSVKDEGMGLDLVNTDSLFSTFYQGKHDKGGTGIGLSYAKSIITNHKGKIGAFNNSNGGAVFYFQLPLAYDASKQNKTLHLQNILIDEDGIEPNEIDNNYLKKFSVVIVEDTTELRNYLKEALSNYFKKVYVAKDGNEGFLLIKDTLPDIIVSDGMMDGMNGFELCKKVKTCIDISHIPFILLTAYYSSQNMYVGYKTGADAFLPKPFEIDGLLSLIRNQLKIREQIRSRYQGDEMSTYQDTISNADEDFLMKLNTVITENISESKLNVAFLATQMYVSRSLLFNKVKVITGMGIVDYVNLLRIEKSIVLLTTTSLAINEIASMVGFSSSRYFSKVFKLLKEENPSVYRDRAHDDMQNISPQ